MNQLAKLDGWSFNSYKSTAGAYTLSNADTESIVNKQTSGLFTIGNGSLSNFTSASATLINGETLYRPSGSTSDNRTYRFNPSTILPKLSASGLTEVNAVAGFELHVNIYNIHQAASNAERGVAFTYNGVTYILDWDNSTGVFRLRTAAGTQLFDSVSSPVPFAINLWTSIKLRAFEGGDGNFYVQASGLNTSYAYGYANLGAISGTFTQLSIPWLARGDNLTHFCNLSIYKITTAQAAAYDDDITADNMLPFQRYLPMLDISRVGGTDWTDTEGVTDPDLAFGDLTDGDLATFAQTSTTNPIGMDGTSNISTLLGNGYYWTPGTLTQLPTIGIVRSVSSSKYKLASTAAESLVTKFGDGTDSIQFSDTTSAVESGETIVNNVFSDNGTFTDGVDSVVIDTATVLRSTIERA